MAAMRRQTGRCAAAAAVLLATLLVMMGAAPAAAQSGGDISKGFWQGRCYEWQWQVGTDARASSTRLRVGRGRGVTDAVCHTADRANRPTPMRLRPVPQPQGTAPFCSHGGYCEGDGWAFVHDNDGYHCCDGMNRHSLSACKAWSE